MRFVLDALLNYVPFSIKVKPKIQRLWSHLAKSSLDTYSTSEVMKNDFYVDIEKLLAYLAKKEQCTIPFLQSLESLVRSHEELEYSSSIPSPSSWDEFDTENNEPIIKIENSLTHLIKLKYCCASPFETIEPNESNLLRDELSINAKGLDATSYAKSYDLLELDTLTSSPLPWDEYDIKEEELDINLEDLSEHSSEMQFHSPPLLKVTRPSIDSHESHDILEFKDETCSFSSQVEIGEPHIRIKKIHRLYY